MGPPSRRRRGHRRGRPRGSTAIPTSTPGLRRRIAERFEADPARVAVGNGSCEILLAAAEALCEPGDELLFAWPSFSIYPHLAALSGAREIRVPLADGYVHDLDAMLAEVTAATQLVCVCNPNNPTGTHLPAERIAEFCERVPDHVTVALDEAYVEFQTDDDPDASIDLLRRVPEPGGPADVQQGHGLAGLRAATRSARPASGRRSTPSASRSASTSWPRWPRPRRSSTATTSPRGSSERSWSGLFVEEGLRELGLEPPSSQANFSWVPLGDRDEAEVIRGLGERGVVVRGGEGLGDPGHIRVTYGTRAENERFLAALGETLAS